MVNGGLYSTWVGSEEFVGRDVVGKERGSWLCFEVTEIFVHSRFVNRIVL
jgi:hypothetical protein